MFTIPAPPPKVKRRADIFAARTMLPPRRAGDFFIGCKYAHNVVYYMQNCARRARKRSLCTGKNKRQGRKTHGRQTLYRSSCPLPLPPARRRGRCFCRRAPPARSARPPRDRVRAQQRNAGPGRQAAAAVSRGVQPEDLPRSARAAAPRACRHRTCTQHTVCGQPCGVLGRAPRRGPGGADAAQLPPVLPVRRASARRAGVRGLPAAPRRAAQRRAPCLLPRQPRAERGLRLCLCVPPPVGHLPPCQPHRPDRV